MDYPILRQHQVESVLFFVWKIIIGCKYASYIPFASNLPLFSITTHSKEACHFGHNIQGQCYWYSQYSHGCTILSAGFSFLIGYCTSNYNFEAYANCCLLQHVTLYLLQYA